MTNKDLSTKRPWKRINNRIVDVAYIDDAGGKNYNIDIENAKLIVKAVNEYDDNQNTIKILEDAGGKMLEKVIKLEDLKDELIEALKEVIESMEETSSVSQGNYTEGFVKAYDKAQKALAKAKQ